MTISDRNKKVLQAVIDSYILSGSPVGSSLLCKQHDFGLSSATLRNIMSELEEQGYLTHPHTSAGRIPTDKGYRYYIDTLISIDDHSDDIEVRLGEAPKPKSSGMHELMSEASQFLAVLSRNAGVVVAPAEPAGAFKHVEFLRLHGRQVLIIFVTSAGTVQNKIIELDEEITQGELNTFSRYLDEELEGRTLPEIRTRLAEKVREERRLFVRLMEETYRASQDVGERDIDKLYIGGATRILDNPEFANVEKVRALFRAFEEKYKLLKVLDMSMSADGIKVFIGSENSHFEMQGCSLVVGSYTAGQKVVGTLGVIGPTRMQYRQVIQVVDYTSRLLSKLLEERMQRGIER